MTDSVSRFSIPREGYLPLAVTGVAFIAVFYPAFVWMSARFLEENSNYSHGFLIPFVVAWLIYQKRPEISQMPVSPSWYGFPLLLAALALHILGGVMLHIGILSGFAVMIALFGLALCLFGAGITRIITVPLLMILFMIPLPQIFLVGVMFRMKMFAAFVAAKIVGAMHIPLERAGSMIYLPNGTLTVGNECSGINSLISLITLSVIFAYVARGSVVKKFAFIAFSVPVALAANICRIVFLIIAAYVYGVAAATESALHYGAGITLWIVALALLAFIWRALVWQPRH